MKATEVKLSKERLPVSDLIGPLELAITTYSYKAKAGPRIYIQGGMHGGELTYWIFEKLATILKQDLVKGEVVLVPIANPVSWQQRAYFYTFGKNDLYMGVDWNRNFPGDPEGSLGERIAAVLFNNAKNSDLAIDLHTSRSSFPFGIFFSKKQLPQLKALGLKYNYLHDLDKDPKAEYFKTFSGSLLKAGTSSFTLECGSHDSYEPEYVDTIVFGLSNLLRDLSMLKGKSKKVEEQLYTYDKLETYFAPASGFARFHKSIGDSFQKGELLYELHTELESAPLKVKAREAGVLEKISPTHIYWAGDEVLEVIPRERLLLL